MQPEREALESLIYEMYQTWGRALGIMFELVRWETHVTPAFGSDPQAVINSQIGDNYDVFIGILWARFGTPTPRAASGTMEEFERAYARVQAGANNPEIMFYFKEAAVPISKIDPEQLKKSTELPRFAAGKRRCLRNFRRLAGLFRLCSRAFVILGAEVFSRPCVATTGGLAATEGNADGRN